MTNTERSQLFKVYGSARRMVREGQLDKGRVNRALGVAQRKAAPEYVTTEDGCTCPDYTYRQGPKGKPCKHILALSMRTLVALEVGS